MKYEYHCDCFHYNKTIDKLSEEENQLVLVDTQLFNLLLDFNSDKREKEFISLMKERSNLIAKLLNYEGLIDMDFINEIEDTIYSFQKFIKDVKINSNQEFETLKKSILN